MAEGLINYDFSDQVEAFSAGTEPKGLNPRAVQVMAELGINISQNSSDHLSQYENQPFDYVVTLCDDANEKCPSFFGGTKRIHMAFEDPPQATGSNDEIMRVYRRVRDEIRERIGAYLRNELSKS